MFELTISIDSIYRQNLEKFYQKLKEELSPQGAIVAFFCDSGRAKVAVAADKTLKEFVKAKVLDGIVFVIGEVFKFEFFQENLLNFSSSVLSLAFVRAISIFDAESDREVIKSQVDLKGEILLDSFFYFKLAPLRERWQKTAMVILKNKVILSESAMCEVLKYLTDNSETATNQVKIVAADERLELLCQGKQKAFNLSPEGVSSFLSEVVAANPLKISLTKQFAQPKGYAAVDLLEDIFGEKISLEN